MDTHRFYVPTARETGQRLRLPDEEAAHAARTLRLGPGHHIRVFDGRGGEFVAMIASTSKAGVTVDLTEKTAPAPEPRVALTLAQALLKGRGFDAVVRDATMLGVRTIQPLMTSHTDVPRTVAQRGATERWNRVAVAAAKQSGRALLPDICPVLSLNAYLSTRRDERLFFLVEPQLTGPRADRDEWRDENPPARAVVSIGPEGGWAREEIAAAAACGARMVTLGGRTLRAEAVPIVAISILLFAWGDL